jgi:hypothetical protein
MDPIAQLCLERESTVKSGIVSHSKFGLFQPNFRHLDPGSGSRIQIQIPAHFESGSNRNTD